MAGSTEVVREDFPQLLRAVLGTYWPPVVKEEHCVAWGTGESYAGVQCTGTFMQPPRLPEPPRAAGEDYPGAQGFNGMTGEHLTIVVHMRLKQGASGAHSGAGN